MCSSLQKDDRVGFAGYRSVVLLFVLIGLGCFFACLEECSPLRIASNSRLAECCVLSKLSSGLWQMRTKAGVDPLSVFREHLEKLQGQFKDLEAAFDKELKRDDERP